MNLQDKLKEIAERAIRSANMRSDDFGHDTDRLASASMIELDHLAGETIPKLLSVIEKLIEQRDSWAAEVSVIECKQEYDISDDDAEILKILGE